MVVKVVALMVTWGRREEPLQTESCPPGGLQHGEHLGVLSDGSWALELGILG